MSHLSTTLKKNFSVQSVFCFLDIGMLDYVAICPMLRFFLTKLVLKSLINKTF